VPAALEAGASAARYGDDCVGSREMLLCIHRSRHRATRSSPTLRAGPSVCSPECGGVGSRRAAMADRRHEIGAGLEHLVKESRAVSGAVSDGSVKQKIEELAKDVVAVQDLWARENRALTWAPWAFAGFLAFAGLGLAFFMVHERFSTTAAWIAVIATLALSVAAAGLFRR
jgi:hypothetical protein